MDSGIKAPHGAEQHRDIIRELFLPANEGYASGGTPINLLNLATIRGDANDAAPIVYFTMKVPDDFLSFTKLEAVWVSPAASGNMYWQFLANYAASGEAYNSHSTGTSLWPTATGGANIMNVQQSGQVLTLPDLASGDYLGFEFARMGNNPTDTLDDVVYLLGLLFSYMADQ